MTNRSGEKKSEHFRFTHAFSLTAYVACSKRSDSGERCEVKKAIKSRGGLGREVFPLSPLPLPRFYFFRAPFYFAPLHYLNAWNRLQPTRSLVSLVTSSVWTVVDNFDIYGSCYLLCLLLRPIKLVQAREEIFQTISAAYLVCYYSQF